MSGLVEQLMQTLGPQVIEQMSGKLGASPQQTRSGLAAALPVILGAMQRNASSPDGASALQGALQRNHANADLGGLVGAVLGGRNSDGAAILGHVLGQRTPRAAQGIGAASGLDGAQAQNLMAMLAPLVMGALGKQASGGGNLASILGGATQQLDQQGGGIGSKLMTAVLDRDGDGDVDFADLAAMASGGNAAPPSGGGGLGGLLGGLFGGGR
ncbi:MAG: DUF937 domain-containing protein [Silanimonas sp.]